VTDREPAGEPTPPNAGRLLTFYLRAQSPLGRRIALILITHRPLEADGGARRARRTLASFLQKRAKLNVVLEGDPEGEQLLLHERPASDRARLDAAPLTAAGTKRVTLDFERSTIAISTLCVLAPYVRVLGPESLRRELSAMAARLRATYG